jgi:hypothetical protein
MAIAASQTRLRRYIFILLSPLSLLHHYTVLGMNRHAAVHMKYHFLRCFCFVEHVIRRFSRFSAFPAVVDE